MRRARVPHALVVAVCGLCLTIVAACDRVAATEVLEPLDVVTGWYDVGIEDGKNKIVPSVSVKLRNKSDRPVRSVQINAIFKRAGEAEMWGEHFGWAVDRDPLAAGAVTAPVVLRSGLGYTSEEARLKMFQNSQFVDAKVEIFLKRGSGVWAKLAEFPIERQLLTQ